MASARNDELDAARLAALRLLVDHANLRLRDALQHRARLIGNIGALKAHARIPAMDKKREAAMLRQFTRAAGKGFSTAALRRIFAAVLRESRALVRSSRVR